MADDDRTLTANITPFGLRMQPDLKVRVEEAARTNERSMNAEIVARLEDSFSLDGVSAPGLTSAEKAQMLNANLKRAMLALAKSQLYAGELREQIRNQREQTERLQVSYTEYRNETEIELARARAEALPDSLRKRIDRRANETGRTSQEELVFALEKAFPPASETDQMISLIEDLLGEQPGDVETIAGDALRQYLAYLKEEQAAGRAEGAYARINEVFTKTPEGRTVRIK